MILRTVAGALAVAAACTLAPADPVSVLDQERASWATLSAADRAHYCDQPRRHAVAEWAESMSEGSTPWAVARPVARQLLAEKCGGAR